MKRGKWTADEEALFRELYPTTPNAEIARRLGRNMSSISNKAIKLGLRKAPGYNNAGGFKKGQKPWNKGVLHCPPGSERGQFSRGNKPHTWQPIGTEVVAKDSFLKRKVRDGCDNAKHNWRYVHHIYWEHYNGRPVPDGHIVRFANGDTRDFSENNLVLVSRQENAVINRWIKGEDIPDNALPVLRTLAQLTMKTNELRENHP